jgi:hypothetical protein
MVGGGNPIGRVFFYVTRDSEPREGADCAYLQTSGEGSGIFTNIIHIIIIRTYVYLSLPAEVVKGACNQNTATG